MCALLETGDWTEVFHNESRVPYAYRHDDWITFENPQSIAEKTQYILDHDYAGESRRLLIPTHYRQRRGN